MNKKQYFTIHSIGDNIIITHVDKRPRGLRLLEFGHIYPVQITQIEYRTSKDSEYAELIVRAGGIEYHEVGRDRAHMDKLYKTINRLAEEAHHVYPD